MAASFSALSISAAVMPENNPIERIASAAPFDAGTIRESIDFRDVPASVPLANDGEIAAMVVFKSSNDTPTVDATPPAAANAYW